MEFEHYITFATICISATALVMFAIIKACDWLIGLKYKTIFDCSKDYQCLEKSLKADLNCLKTDFASKETVKNMKEDMDEMKNKINDIHDVIMTFAVNNFKSDR